LDLDVTDGKINWFDEFMGLGYHIYDIRPNVYLIFDGRKKLVNTWNQIIKYWPDDEIKMRFFEGDSAYEFILYSPSRILITTWIFLKSLKISEHYEQFKEEYNGSATLQMALYFPKKKTYELEVFKYKKKITDVKFYKADDDEDDFLVSRARQKLKNPAEKLD
jgi:hypothetical protein